MTLGCTKAAAAAALVVMMLAVVSPLNLYCRKFSM